jgi:hypothetical protein
MLNGTQSKSIVSRIPERIEEEEYHICAKVDEKSNHFEEMNSDLYRLKFASMNKHEKNGVTGECLGYFVP